MTGPLPEPRRTAGEPGPPPVPPSPRQEPDLLREQIEDLRQALDAIRAGGVDAVVIHGPEGEQIYTLSNADRPYRVLVDEMGEGAATVSERGVLLYVNRRLAQLLGRPASSLLGRDVDELVPDAESHWLREFLRVAPGTSARAELELAARNGSRVPVLASATGLQLEGVTVRCLVVADLTERWRAEQELAEANAAMLRAKTELVEETQRIAHVGNWSWTLADNRVELSPQMLSIFMLHPREEPWTFCAALAARAYPSDVVSLMVARDRAVREAGTFEISHRLAGPDGQTRHVLVRGRAVIDVDGHVTGITGTAQDITAALSEAEQALSRTAAEFAAAFEHNPVGMALANLDQRILRANPAMSEITGRPLDRLAGMTLTALFEPEDAETTAAEFRAVATGRSDGFRCERRLLSQDGRTTWVRLDVAPVREDGRDCYVVIHLEDISARKVYEERLHYLADHDPLTGLLNRRAFREQFDRHLSLSARYGTGGALVLLDLDNFKYINDTLGHTAGDTLLRDVSQAMGHRLRDTDVLARLGGDEFAVLLWGVDCAGAVRATEDLLSAVRSTSLGTSARPMNGSASAGVVVLERGVGTADEILTHADLAMYAAKESAGDRLHVYDPTGPLASRSRRTLLWLDRVRQALSGGLLRLVAQPILDLSSGRISSCELLIRLRDQGQLIPPEHFLDIAQKHGLALTIDQFVVREAIRIAATGAQQPGFRWEVNLSPVALADPAMPDLIEAELSRHGVSPHSLIFEITETAAIASMPQAEAFANRITGLGCSFALDDFGSGYGSFYYLKHLPLDFVKIDGEFVHDLTSSRINQVLVRAVINTAHELGMRTIAEYVEDEDTLQLLSQYQVDQVQGLYIGPHSDPETPFSVTPWHPPATADTPSEAVAEPRHRSTE